MTKCEYSYGGSIPGPCQNVYLGCNGKCWLHCPFGIAQDTRMKNITETFQGYAAINKAYRDMMEEWLDHGVQEHNMPDNRPNRSHEGNGKHMGEWAFTLTKSPTDDLTEEDMIKAVQKIMNQKSCPVKKYAWYLEYKENGSHPHIHGMYETESGGRIEKKHWKRAWKIWDENHKLGAGFRGGYHRPVRNGECYTDYIKKDGGKSESLL